jgi:hypothetical protein
LRKTYQLICAEIQAGDEDLKLQRIDNITLTGQRLYGIHTNAAYSTNAYYQASGRHHHDFKRSPSRICMWKSELEEAVGEEVKAVRVGWDEDDDAVVDNLRRI